MLGKAPRKLLSKSRRESQTSTLCTSKPSSSIHQCLIRLNHLHVLFSEELWAPMKTKSHSGMLSSQRPRRCSGEVSSKQWKHARPKISFTKCPIYWLKFKVRCLKKMRQFGTSSWPLSSNSSIVKSLYTLKQHWTSSTDFSHISLITLTSTSRIFWTFSDKLSITKSWTSNCQL